MRFRVDGVEFSYSSGESAPDHFCIRKPRHLVDATVALLRDLRSPRIVELGIASGGSTALIALVSDPHRIAALELSSTPVAALAALIERRGLSESVRPFYGVDQGDRERLASIVDGEFGAEPLDLVIDDASHQLDETRASFETLFPRLRPGGCYVIEDWNWQMQIRYGIAGRPGDPGGGLRPEVREALDASGADGRGALREYIRENLERTPLETLALELVVARACSGHVVQDLFVDESWVVVRRGPGALDPAGFRLRDHYVDPRRMIGR